MRKRSKVRIPQDTLPWVRIADHEEQEDVLNTFLKKPSNWFSGNRRKLQTTLLTASKYDTIPGYLRSSVREDRELLNSNSNVSYQNNFRAYYINNFHGMTKPRNFCLFLGHGHTYNRKLFVSRQALRKLVRTGLISGLQKK